MISARHHGSPVKHRRLAAFAHKGFGPVIVRACSGDKKTAAPAMSALVGITRGAMFCSTSALPSAGARPPARVQSLTVAVWSSPPDGTAGREAAEPSVVPFIEFPPVCPAPVCGSVIVSRGDNAGTPEKQRPRTIHSRAPDLSSARMSCHPLTPASATRWKLSPDMESRAADWRVWLDHHLRSGRRVAPTRRPRSGSVGCDAAPSAVRRTCRRAPGCRPRRFRRRVLTDAAGRSVTARRFSPCRRKTGGLLRLATPVRADTRTGPPPLVLGPSPQTRSSAL